MCVSLVAESAVIAAGHTVFAAGNIMIVVECSVSVTCSGKDSLDLASI